MKKISLLLLTGLCFFVLRGEVVDSPDTDFKLVFEFQDNVSPQADSFKGEYVDIRNNSIKNDSQIITLA